MKIAYVTVYDGKDITNWSGTSYYIGKTLMSNSEGFDYVGPLNQDLLKPMKIKKYIIKKIFNQTYMPERTSLIAKSYSQQVQRHLSGLSPDIIFSPGTLPISYLDCR